MFEPTNIDDPDDVLDLFNDLKAVGVATRRRFDEIGDQNRNWYHGQQTQTISLAPGQTSQIFWPENLGDTPIVSNDIRNLVNMHKAQITRDLPDVSFKPVVASDFAVEAARVSNALKVYQESEMDFDQLQDKCVHSGAIDGVAGFKICYRKDEDAVQWSVVKQCDFYIDPMAEDYRDARWVIFRTAMDPYEVKAKFNLEDDPPITQEKANNNPEFDAVVVYELWHKPNARVPKGVYCNVIGEKVYNNIPFPYVLPSLEDESQSDGPREAILPLFYYKTDEREGTPYADTWLTDVIPEQQQLNECDAAITNARRLTAGIKLITNSKEIHTQWSLGDKVIFDPMGFQGSGFPAPPQISSVLFSDRDYHQKRMYDKAGQNEQLAGVLDKSSTTTPKLKFLADQDAAKQKGTSLSFQKMLRNAWYFNHQLVRHYYLTSRLMRITNDVGGFAVQAFKGANLGGIDCVIEPSSGFERLHDTQSDQAAADAQAGWIQPAEALERRSTGLSQTVAAATTREQIQRQAAAVVQGATPEVDPTVDAQIAADEILRITHLMLQGGASGHQLESLQGWRQLYVEPAPAPAPPPAAPAPLPPDQAAQAAPIGA